MKNLFLPVLLLLAITLNAQNSESSKNMYPFQTYYVNLDKLTVVPVDVVLSKTFKSESKYACRFQVPMWFKQFPLQARYGNLTFSINENDEIIIKDNAGSVVKSIENKDPDIKTENVSGSNFIVIADSGVVNIKRLWGVAGYAVRYYDFTGSTLHSFFFEHTKYVFKENVSYSYPYLNYLMHTPVFMIFTSYDDNYKKTILLNLNQGKTVELDNIINGVIRGEDEKNILGYIEINTEKKSCTATINDKIINLKSTNYSYRDVETLVKDSVLVMATYSKLATGSALSAYNIKNGNLLWEADVKQFMVDHSEYYNNVTLSLYGDKVIMEGTETHGSYLQIFDIKSGKRLFIKGDFKEE
jgi:hypothetical protein